MPRKKLRLKFIGNKKFLFNMLCFILSAAASTGLLVLTTNLLVLTKSDEFM